MDVDRFIVQNQPAWDRLAVLTRAARGRPTLAQVEELVQLYQRTSAHLSHARSERADPALVARLTRLVADAASTLYGTRSRSVRSLGRFFTTTFPAAVWHARRFVLVAALLLLVPAFAVGTWIGVSDAALEASGPEAVREAYVTSDFEAYYSSSPAAEFASSVTINNIQVAILAFAAGALLCVATAWILAYNGANVGVAGGLFAAVGEQPKFWGLILPHGILELSAVIVAAAAGLAIGWAVIAPGDRPRGQALAEEGRRAAAVVMGVVLAFIVAGMIEGFVTPSGLPTWARVGIGTVAGLAFWTWVLVLGRRAALLGYTGAVGEHDRLARTSALPG